LWQCGKMSLAGVQAISETVTGMWENMQQCLHGCWLDEKCLPQRMQMADADALSTLLRQPHNPVQFTVIADVPCVVVLLLLVPERTLVMLASKSAMAFAHDQLMPLREGFAAMQSKACDYGIRQMQIVDLTTQADVSEMLQCAKHVHAEAGQVIWNSHLQHQMGNLHREVLARCRALGIADDYGWTKQLPMQRQAQQLVHIGEDCFQRQQFATAATAAAWQALQAQAHRAGVDVQLVSAYRSHDYQQQLLQRKLQQGQRLEDILLVSAAPGFSEHHSGRALDLTSAGCAPLSTEFADTDAYRWLQAHAANFGFIQSYPRDNVHGIAWEPWHWCWQPGLAVSE